VKPADSERVLRAVTMVVDARDSTGTFSSQTARNNTLFLCPLTAGGCDELAVVVSVRGCKTSSLGGWWTRMHSRYIVCGFRNAESRGFLCHLGGIR
jgi:hypothetical protein